MPHILAGSGSSPADIAGLRWRVYLRVFISALSGILFALAWIRWEPQGNFSGSLTAGLFSGAVSEARGPETFAPEVKQGPVQRAETEFRDPFAPMTLDSGRKHSGRKHRLLKGLFREGGRQFALIGSRMVTKGDWIFGMRVITIRNNKVVLANNRKIRVLFLF